jgi:predicted nucleic acid-binding protein
LRYLLDTDVVSQATKDSPHAGVIRWLDEQEEEDLFLSVATLLEIRTGIELSSEGKKKKDLEEWLVHALPDRFDDRIVPVERHVADLTGRLIARSRSEGWKMAPMDALIGATAMVNDMGLASLNWKHFERLELKLVKF